GGLFGLLLVLRRGDVAGKQQQAGVGGCVDARLVFEEAAHFGSGLHFDGLVFDLLAGRAPVGCDAGGGGRRAAPDQGAAARQAGEPGQGKAGQQESLRVTWFAHYRVSPRSKASIPSHSAWSRTMWTSWMRMVRSWGTHRWMSVSCRRPAMLPPP